MELDHLILPESFEFSIRRVAVAPTSLPSPCYRFTGAGDRPCEQRRTPLSYGLWPFSAKARLDAMLMYWSWSKIDVENPIVYADAAPRPIALLDHSWVEVARYAERTSYVGSDGGGYGLWYWVTPGSNLSVNVGAAVRFENKHQAIKWANWNAGSNVSLDCLDFSEHESCADHDDTLFCAAVRARGLDSMMVKRKRIKFGHVSGRHSDVIELIYCPPEEPPEQTSCCPSMVELRLADGKTACTCNASGAVSNCLETGFDGAVAMADDYGNRPAQIISLWAVLFVVLPALVLMALCHWILRGRRGRKRSGSEAPDVALPLLNLPTSSCQPPPPRARIGRATSRTRRD